MYFLIISGMSGAGKSRAVATLEDLGYYCVDNLPIALIPRFAEVCLGEEGELAEVFNAVDILGFNALFVHEVTVILNVFVNVLYLSHEALALKLFHVLAGHTFNFLVPIFFHWV